MIAQTVTPSMKIAIIGAGLTGLALADRLSGPGASDDSLKQQFLNGLLVLSPDLDVTTIVSIHINRAFKVQPLQVVGYSELVPTTVTPHPDFFVLNTSQFAANTLNNNDVIRSVDQFADLYEGCFACSNEPASAAIPQVQGVH